MKQTTVNGITRHRVWVGIYPSLEAAEKAQQKLAARQVNSALAQVKQ
ncbi:MAG: SPOR domain-containing protein [Gammaproteobacteria bacterium]